MRLKLYLDISLRKILGSLKTGEGGLELENLTDLD